MPAWNIVYLVASTGTSAGNYIHKKLSTREGGNDSVLFIGNLDISMLIKLSILQAALVQSLYIAGRESLVCVSHPASIQIAWPYNSI
jgi:hypothetical protein